MLALSNLKINIKNLLKLKKNPLLSCSVIKPVPVFIYLLHHCHLVTVVGCCRWKPLVLDSTGHCSGFISQACLSRINDGQQQFIVVCALLQCAAGSTSTALSPALCGNRDRNHN